MKYFEHKDAFKNLMSLALIIFIDNLTYYVVVPLLLRIVMHGAGHIVSTDLSFEFRNILFSTIVASAPLASLIAAPFIGDISDRWGRKKTLLICLFGSVLAFALPISGVYLGSLSLIILGRIIGGFAGCSQTIALAAVADVTNGKEKAKFYGVIFFSISLALLLGPFIGSLLSDPHLSGWFDISTPYLIGLALALFNIILLLEFFTEIPFVRRQQFSSATLVRFVKYVAKNWEFSKLFLSFFLLQFSWALYYQNNYLYFSQVYHYTTDKIGIFASYLGLLAVFGILMIYPRLLRQHGVQQLYQGAIFTLCISLALSFIPNATLQWFVAIPLGFSGAIMFPAGLTLLSDAFPPERQGFLMGMITFMISISWLLSGLLPGLLIDVAPWLALMISCLAMITALFLANSKLIKARLHNI
jgi:MFS family permease